MLVFRWLFYGSLCSRSIIDNKRNGSGEQDVLKVIFEAGVVQNLLVFALSIFAFYNPNPSFWKVPPVMLPHLKVQVATDHLLLGVQGFLHAIQDVLMRFILHESQRVYLITGQRRKLIDFFIDVFGEMLATWAEDILLVFEDVFERGAGNVVAELPLGLLFHRNIYKLQIEIYNKTSDIDLSALP